MGKRIEELVNELDDSEEKHIAFVTHGGAIADFLRNIFSEKDLLSLRCKFSSNVDYRIDECSVTQITKDNDSFLLTNLHYIEHLTN